MNKQEVIKLLKRLNLPISDYYVLSSGCLVLYGLRNIANDLDLCVKPELFEKLRVKYNLKEENKNECGFYHINDLVEVVVSGKYPFEFDVVEGYQVQKLEQILNSKINSDKPKDKADVENILNYLKKNKTH